jgi:hypothetical protein|tara:strand:- start:454 stop:894 length:441 start_codon:yes stop_codon:yes gene_type:complete
MSDDLISLQDKRISELEAELEVAKKRRDNLIDSTKDKLEPMRYEIERTIDGWNLTLPLGKDMKTPVIIEGLESLKACVVMFSVGYKKSQFRNQPFELYDHNSRTLFRDYRVYAEWATKAEKDSKKLIKEVKRNRLSNTEFRIMFQR